MNDEKILENYCFRCVNRNKILCFACKIGLNIEIAKACDILSGRVAPPNFIDIKEVEGENRDKNKID